MIIIFLVILKITLQKLEVKEKEITLYPTQGKYFKYNIDEVIYLNISLSTISSLICNMSSHVPNVELINSWQEVYQTKGNNFKSLSSNNSHFAAIIQYCLLILILYAYQAEIQSIVNGSNTFIVYAQYFQNYTIVSLFSAQFQNLSSFNNTFIDSDISNRINPYIYTINSQEIFQFSISSDYTFELKSNFTFPYCLNFTIINASQNSKVLCSKSNNGKFLVFLWGCQNSIIYQSHINIDFSFQTILKIHNSQYIQILKMIINIKNSYLLDKKYLKQLIIIFEVKYCQELYILLFTENKFKKRS